MRSYAFVVVLFLAACGGGSTGPTAQAKVHLVDGTGAPVAGAIVSGTWSGAVTAASTATSDANGDALVLAPASDAKGAYTFTVGSVAKPGFTYDAASNTMVASTLTR